MKRRSLLPWVLVLISLAPLAAAEDAPRPLRVMIEKGGLPVEGLTLQELRAYLDGEKVELEAVEEVREGDLPFQGLVVLDEAFAIKGPRNRALADLQRLVPLLGPEDRLALIAFDGRSVEVLAPATASRAELTKALEQAVQRPAFGLLRHSERQYLEMTNRRRRRPPEADSFAGVGFSGFARTPLQLSGEGLHQHRQAAEAADAVVEAMELAALGDGASLILLSGGWLPPDSPAAECFPLVETLLATAIERDIAIYPAPVGAQDPKAGDALLDRLAILSGGLPGFLTVGEALLSALADNRNHYRLYLESNTGDPATAPPELELEVLFSGATLRHSRRSALSASF